MMNAKLRMGFVLDPPEKIKCLEDTSFYIMKEAYGRGHEIFYLDSRSVYFQNNQVLAQASRVAVNFDDGFKFLSREECLPLESLDLIFIRKDPPFDAHYLYLTYLLEQLKGKVPMLNDPAGIRGANEKLYALNFPEWIPRHAVSAREDVMLAFVEQEGDAVVKPLNERGGKDIVRVKRGESGNAEKVRQLLAKYGTLLAQEFLPEIQTEGDKRIIVLNGDILGGYVRVPPKGDFRVSVDHDGRYEKAVFTEREKEMVRAVSPRFLKDGLYFVGLDVIGGLISEINVTSPAGIPESSHFVDRRLEVEVVDFLEVFGKKKATVL